MESTPLDQTLDELRITLEQDNLDQATAIVEALRPADQADIFTELNEEEQVSLLPELHPIDSADILEELSDEAADLLDDLHEDLAEAVLAGLEDSDEIRWP